MISPTAITIDVSSQKLQVQLKNQQQIINVIQQPTTIEIQLGYDANFLVSLVQQTREELKKYVLKTELVFRD